MFDWYRGREESVLIQSRLFVAEKEESQIGKSALLEQMSSVQPMDEGAGHSLALPPPNLALLGTEQTDKKKARSLLPQSLSNGTASSHGRKQTTLFLFAAKLLLKLSFSLSDRRPSSRYSNYYCWWRS